MTNISRSAVAAVVSYTVARRWTIVVLLALASVVAYVDRVNLSVALIDVHFKEFFQLTNADRGMVSSAFFWSYALLQIPAGWIVDRYGSKYPMAISFTIWSLLTAATALTTGFASLFAVRLLLGIGEAVMHPASMRWIRFNFPETQRGLAIGVFISGSKFGPAIGAVAAAWLIESHGWQTMFFVLGFGSLIWLLPWLLLVKNDQGVQGVDQATTGTAATVPMQALLASPMLWGTVIGTFCYMYFVYFCLTWMPAYLSEARGLSLGSSSLYTTFSFAGMATVSIIGGWSADRLIARGIDAVKVRRAFTIAGFAMASTVLIGASSESLDVALFFAVLSLSGLGLTTANYWALTQTLIPGGSIGRIVGIQNFAASLAGIVSPILTGWLVHQTGSYTAPMQTVVVFIVLGIAVYSLLVRAKYAPVPIAPSSQDAQA
jgi:ACS family D-galactonate transporter-like MFS transporter